MSDNLSIYSPSDITVSITRSDGFSHIVGGYTEDAMVSVEPAAEAFTQYTSADNRSTLIFHPNNNSATVMLSLNQASSSNDVLYALYAEFLETKSVSKLFTITIKDNNGRSLCVSPQAFIGKRPTMSFGNGVQVREWTVLCHDMEQRAGGNSKFSNADVASMNALGASIEDRWLP